jgi:hypothetical protein
MVAVQQRTGVDDQCLPQCPRPPPGPRFGIDVGQVVASWRRVRHQVQRRQQLQLLGDDVRVGEFPGDLGQEAGGRKDASVGEVAQSRIGGGAGCCPGERLDVKLPVLLHE